VYSRRLQQSTRRASLQLVFHKRLFGGFFFTVFTSMPTGH
jgi:hypothetical protein